MKQFGLLLGTWFGCGYVPKGPGTAGSVGGLLVALVLYHFHAFTPLHFAILAAVFLYPAIWSASVVAKVTDSKDPQIVVVDEVVGQWITLAGAASLASWKAWLLAFVLFRAFDIVKPPPVRAFEKLPNGTGIVMDDVMAGVYGALVMWAAGWFNLY